MRETPNIKLTQFDPNDVPNWLDHYNSDMVKVDTAIGAQGTENSKYETRFAADEALINNNRTQISENTQDIANVKDDIKNIKGGSTTSLANLQADVTLVSHSLTTLKGGSDKTIAELENDLNTDKTDISALDGRVETLEGSTATLEADVTNLKNNATDNSDLQTTVNRLNNAVGTGSVSNFGSDVTSAIGNVDLKVSKSPLSVSDVLNKMINHHGVLTFDVGHITGISGAASIDFAKNSVVCVPALLNMRIISTGGTLNAGTHTIFTAPLARLPKLKPGSFVYLFDESDVLGLHDSTSTAEKVSFYLRTTTSTFDVIAVIPKGQWIFKAKTGGTLIFPVVLPVDPF